MYLNSLNIYSLFWLLIAIVLGPSQGWSNKDSLLLELDKVTSVEKRLDIMYRLGTREHFSSDSNIMLLKEVLTTSRREHNYDFEAKALNSLGIAFWKRGERDSAEYFYLQGIERYLENQDSTRLVRTYRNLIINSTERARYEEGLEYYKRALKFVSDDDLQSKYSLTDVVIFLFQRQEKFDKAVEYGRRALKIARQMESIPSIAFSYKYIGEAFNNLSEYDSSFYYFEKAADLFKGSPDQIGYSSILTNMGGNLMQLERYDEAISFLSKSEKIKMELQDMDLCSNYSAQALTLYHLGRYDEALSYIDKIHSLENKTHDVLCLSKALYTASRVLYYMKDFEGAYETHLKSIEYKDSVLNTSNSQMVAKLQTELELKEKEAEIAKQNIELLKQDVRNNRILILAGILLGLLILGFVAYRQFVRRREMLQQLKLDQQIKEKRNLEALSNMRRQFFTNISHELKTPLTLISGPLSEALDGMDEKDRNKEVVQLAERNSRHLLGLVNEILQLAKLESGHMPVQNRPLEAVGFLRRLFFSFDSFAQTQGVELKFESNISECGMMTDGDHLDKIVSNLISNAIKYSPNGGVVSLICHFEDREGEINCNVEVRDTGVGIPEDQVKHIFERYYQSPDIRGHERGGVGIGLSLASELTKSLGGTLTCDSEVGKGSVFRMSLISPAALIEKEKESDEKGDYEISLGGYHEKNVLVVEDHEDMQAYLKRILQPHFKVIIAGDGFEALQTLQKKQVDLIMSDVMMPKMDGYRLREQIMAMERYKRIPFLFLTARSLEDDVMHGFSLGVDDYITKPFNPKSLLARIVNLLANSTERQRFAAEEGVVEDRELTKLQQFESLLKQRYGDNGLKIPELASELSISERQLRRLTKAETGMSPVEMLLEVRLLKARSFIEGGKYGTVSEVMYQVGIESASYFSRKFTERFGLSPSEMMK